MEIHIQNYVISWNLVFGLEANTGKLVENSAEENALVNVLWEILCRLGWENTSLSSSNQNLKITAGLISEPCGQADNRECADDPTGGKVVETGERLWGVWWEGIEGEQLHFWQYSLLLIRCFVYHIVHILQVPSWISCIILAIISLWQRIVFCVFKISFHANFTQNSSII